MKKFNCGIIGTGNIGTDLLFKINKSNFLRCNIFAGRDENSKGIARAKDMGINTTIDSIDYIVKNPDCCDIVFDCTSAATHKIHAPILKELNKFVIDLTPAKVGPFCCPVLNIHEAIKSDNVNMITCGGQASVPIAYAIKKALPQVDYFEIVASIASKSAGLGTRNNIDEFTQTTSDALKYFTGVKNSKAIIILNPAEPPVKMRNTIYAIVDKPNVEEVKKQLVTIEKQIQEYVPGYHIITGPVFEHNRLTVIIEVIGAGDFLPTYAGNLDIITSAAVKTAEEYVKSKYIN